MEYTNNLSYFTIFVGTISILVYGVHCPVKHNFSSCGFPIGGGPPQWGNIQIRDYFKEFFNMVSLS